MSVVHHRRRQAAEEAFVEGEPDLRPPEEGAVGVVDEVALLEGDLGCDLVVDHGDGEIDDDLWETVVDELSLASVDGAEDGAHAEFLCSGCGLILPESRLVDPGGLLCRDCTS